MTSIHNSGTPMGCPSGYAEEEWVDFVIGKLSHGKRQLLERHLDECTTCRQYVEEWSKIYSASGMLEEEGSTSRYDSMHKRSLYDKYSQPLPDLKYLESLQRYVKRQGRLKQWKRKLIDHKYMTASALAACFLLIITLVMFNHRSIAPAQVDQYVLHHEPSAASFVGAINSAKYRVEAAEGHKESGYLWLKDDLSEVFLWLENLPELDRNDYQAWAISGKEASSLGIIQRVGSQGHLYTQTSYLHPSDFIMLTVEPKGGSAAPTSKQIVLVVKQQ